MRLALTRTTPKTASAVELPGAGAGAGANANANASANANANGGASGTLAAAAPARSMLTLPTVFEQVHAGQRLRCLAVVLNAPGPSCRLWATLEPPTRSAARLLGDARGAGRIDMAISGVLTEPGQHELIVTLADAAAGAELLRKVYRIEVAQGLACAYAVTPLPRGAAFVSCKLTNVSRTLPMSLARVELVASAAVVGVTRVGAPDAGALLLCPGEAATVLFSLRNADALEHLGTLNVDWVSGLGEAGEWSAPIVRRARRADFAMNVAEAPRQALVGAPLELVVEGATGGARLLPASRDDALLVHGPLHQPAALAQMRFAVVPTRPGVVPDVAAALGFDEGACSELPLFVRGEVDALVSPRASRG